jgi:hypothetical protein
MKPNTKRLAMLSGALALLLALTAPTTLRGDEWDLQTHFSANQPLEVPGMVLEPNTTYLIRLLPGPTTRQVVQIFTENRMQLLTTFQAVSETRQRPVEDTLFEFMEVPAGNPVPIRSWFYPGRMTGLEFMYSNDQREKIANYTDQTAGVTQSAALFPGEQNTQSQAPDRVERPEVLQNPVIGDDNQGVEEDFGVNPSDEPVTTDDALDTDATDDNVITTQESDAIQPTDRQDTLADEDSGLGTELPATAGALSLLALIGTLSTGLGLSSRFARRR